MKDWIITFAIIYNTFMVMSLGIPCLLLARDDRREAKRKAQTAPAA
ncbi:MAG: hypothetical protein WDO68_21550 [Gammaproteobacteria bacterium]